MLRRTRFCQLTPLLLLLALEIPLSLISLSAKSPTSAPCTAPEYREFDFWLGDWDAFNIADSIKDAHVRVDRLLDGCVIHEDYQSVDGHKGESFSIYDASRKVWHQSWVTNRGQLLIIEGRMEDNAMVLAGSDRPPAKSAASVAFGSRSTAVCAKRHSLRLTQVRLGNHGSISCSGRTSSLPLRRKDLRRKDLPFPCPANWFSRRKGLSS